MTRDKRYSQIVHRLGKADVRISRGEHILRTGLRLTIVPFTDVARVAMPRPTTPVRLFGSPSYRTDPIQACCFPPQSPAWAIQRP
jgi:hypothetical protein